MNLKFKIGESCSDLEKNSNDEYTLIDVNIADFFDQIMEDEVIKEFFEDESTKKKLISIIGVDTVLSVFDKTEILEKCTWEYIKDFFLDNLDENTILNYIGWDKVKQHFSDYIESSEEESPNDINIDNGPSMMEALNGDRRKDKEDSV